MEHTSFAFPGGESRPGWLSFPVRGLGLLFVIAGASKLPMLGTFARTISSLLGTGTAPALVAALMVAGIELGAGSALMLSRRVRPAAALLAVLTLVFLFFLLHAYASAQPFVCNCFGVLGVQLSTGAELLLDAVLFDLLVMAAILWGSGGAVTIRPARAAGAGMLMAGILALELVVLKGLQDHRVPSPPEVLPVVTYAAGRSPGAAIEPGQRALVLLLNFADFTCPLCFEDFLGIVDSLRASARAGGKALAIMQEGGAERLSGGRRLERWAEETGISFPVVLVPDSVFASARFSRSMVAVLGEGGRTIFHAEFPMGRELREEALRLFFQ